MQYQSTVLFLLASCTHHLLHAYPDSVCHKTRGGLWVRDPNDCMVSHQCDIYGGVAQTFTCNTSQVWSVMANACVQERDPLRDDCHGRPAMHIRNDPRYIKPNGNNPDPDDCSAFLACSDVATTSSKDADRLIPTMHCMQPIMYNSASPHADDPRCIKPNDDPRCIKPNGNNPDPDDCSAFLACSNGTMVARQVCSDTTLYLAPNDTCQYAALVAPFCQGTIPDRVLLVKSHELCIDLEDRLVASPDDPCSYIQCYLGQVHKVERCPYGTAFNQERGYCDWSYNSRCTAMFQRYTMLRKRTVPPTTTTTTTRTTRATNKGRRRIWGHPSWGKDYPYPRRWYDDVVRSRGGDRSKRGY